LEILVVVYRPGSQAVQQCFFDELSVVLECFGTYSTPLFIAGDFNIWLDRPTDPHAIKFRSLLAAFGITITDTGPTHVRVGTLGVVAGTCATVADLIDCGISDHHALCWRSAALPPSFLSTSTDSPMPSPVMVRPWRRLDMAAFRAVVSCSGLCQPETWPDDIDQFGEL
jgi:hypothetical protein